MAKEVVASLIGLVIIASPFVITAIKKRRQVGKLWSGPVRATLEIAGKQLCCRHCEHTKFRKREGILVTSWIAFFRFAFWNQSAVCYTCVQCGHIEWFVYPPEGKIEFERDY